MTVTEAVNAAHEGKLKAIYIMGENPMVSDPDINHVREALENLEFLVVQDIFMTETAKLADVVLPATSFAEEDGTFTNTERRVQLLRPAVKAPGEARSDWKIICDIASRMGYEMSYGSTAEIMEEVASLTPLYGGITHDRLEGDGLQWPCPDKDHPGTPYLHKGKFSRGLGLFTAVEHVPPAEVPDDEYPLVLTTGRMLFHFHTGSMTRRSKGLHKHRPEGYIELHPETAQKLGVGDGEMVRVSSRRGQIKVKALVTTRTSPKVVFMPFHFAESAANVLTNAALDPKSKIPEFKACAVKVEKLADEAESLDVADNGSLGKACDELKVSPRQVCDAVDDLLRISPLFGLTGAAHAAALCSACGIVYWSEDIGRHNAVDRVVGQCFLEGDSFEDKYLATTGRINSEMVKKAAACGVRLIASKAPPTDLGVGLADRLGISVVGFVRNNRLNVYTHPDIWRRDM